MWMVCKSKARNASPASSSNGSNPILQSKLVSFRGVVFPEIKHLEMFYLCHDKVRNVGRKGEKCIALCTCIMYYSSATYKLWPRLNSRKSAISLTNEDDFIWFLGITMSCLWTFGKHENVWLVFSMIIFQNITSKE